MSLFATKPIEVESDRGLVRSLGAGDLIMLAIGAVIGAGIFSAIGTAAAGEYSASGEMVRAGAGPALVLSFVLLGAVCGLAALCYAELASMIPQAGSAYTYTYATMGEFLAWLIGWDLILEYAVGNIAVAVAWSGYFTSVLSGFGITFPGWLTHGYLQARLSTNPEVSGLLDSAPHLFGIPLILNVPAFLIVALITWVLYLGVRESARVNNVIVVIKLLVLGLFVIVGAQHINPDNFVPFAPNGFRGIHQGAAIVFFAYIGFDAVSTAAEETRDPQRNLPIGILGGLAICTLIYVIVGAVAVGLVPYRELATSDPLATALLLAGLPTASWIVAAGATIALTAVLLVFQYGQPRIFFSMAKDGLMPRWAAKVHPKYHVPHVTTVLTGAIVGLGALVAEENMIYDLTNIGTLFAFFLVCLAVLVLRHKDPDRPRAFRVPFVWVVGPLGAAACLFIMKGLPRTAWERFGIWLVLGVVIYFFYGRTHSVLTTGRPIDAPDLD
jgi:APA family basic amino acid/polyamine antiporter